MMRHGRAVKKRAEDPFTAMVLAARVIEARRAARTILGEKYADTVGQVKTMLETLADAWKTSYIDAARRLMKSMHAKGELNATDTMLLLAAVAELAEKKKKE
ncbi:MAG: hypothetical protein ABFD89_16640 [Bryobacteraceae bacterium]